MMFDLFMTHLPLCFMVGMMLAMWPKPCGAMQSLLANGSFEEGFADWHVVQDMPLEDVGAIVEGGSPDGAWHLEMGGNGASTEGERIIFTSVPVEVGKSYRLKMTLRAEGAQDGDFLVRLLCYRMGDDGVPVQTGFAFVPARSGVFNLLAFGGTSPWRQFDVYLDEECFQVGTVQAALLLVRRNNGRGVVGIDQVVWEETPREIGPIVWDSDSFEHSSAPFLSLRRRKGDAWHGDYSLLLPKEEPSVFFHYLTGILSSTEPSILSFYARSDVPCTLHAGGYNELYGGVGSGSFSLNSEWRLCKVNLNPAAGSHLGIAFSSTDAQADILLDAMTVRRGTTCPQEYSSAAVTFGVEESGLPGEVYYESEAPLVRVASIRNNQESLQNVAFEICVESPGRPPVEVVPRTEIELAGTARLDVPFEALASTLSGYYVIRMTVEYNGIENTVSAPFAVTPPPWPVSEESNFGFHIGDYRAYKRVGLAHARDFRVLEFWPKKDGHYVADAASHDSHDLHFTWGEHGIRQMNTLNIATFIAKATGGDPDKIPYEELELFATDLARGCIGGYSNWFEIDNEPHLGFPPIFNVDMKTAADIYSTVARRMADKILEENPDAKILAAGTNITHPPHKEFLYRTMENIGGIIDVIPVHPYADSRYIDSSYSDLGPDECRFYEDTVEIRNTLDAMGFHPEIWYGETGWALDYHEDYLGIPALRHAAYVTQLMLAAKSADVKKVFYFMGDQHYERGKYYYGIWRHRQPLPAVQSYATCAHYLDGAEPVRVVRHDEVRVHVYRGRDGGLFAAVWLLGKRETKAILPLNGNCLEIRDFLNRKADAATDVDAVSFEASWMPVFVFAGEGLAEDAFLAGLEKMSFKIPPVNVSWRIVKEGKVEVSLRNGRGEAFEGSLSYNQARSETIALSIAAGETVTLEFEYPRGTSRQLLTVSGTGNLGEFVSDFLVDVMPCPKMAPADFNDGLPAESSLPVMASRDFLLPNDPNNGWNGPDDLALKSFVGYDDECLFLMVDVSDDVHCQENGPGTLWQGDAIQLAIDTRADARPAIYSFDDNDFELGFGLNADGPQVEVTFHGDRVQWKDVIAKVDCRIQRVEGLTHYRIAIPWTCLGMKPIPGTVFGLNFIVLDNDGSGVFYTMGLTGGIYESKNPYAYRKFFLK